MTSFEKLMEELRAINLAPKQSYAPISANEPFSEWFSRVSNIVASHKNLTGVQNSLALVTS